MIEDNVKSFCEHAKKISGYFGYEINNRSAGQCPAKPQVCQVPVTSESTPAKVTGTYQLWGKKERGFYRYSVSYIFQCPSFDFLKICIPAAS